ncbi:hypothetical protein OVA24_15345 [Luteolibacter sp. SL250]|uniref:hypothetical protein n=1 Tax=Luteolibacter sp. SL250 TaxID=2995170 RepID=UPI002270BE65|nr:hypothetical protein [Luteolibacter sp. SL250]WAC18606.1 hypothetical protein OVA24_15345 [Luteolibacter sp. SL250]
MEPTPLHRVVALLLVGSIVPLSAQNFSEASRPTDVHPLGVSDLEGRDAQRFNGVSLPGTYEVPATKAAAHLKDAGEVFMTQDAATLASNHSGGSNVAEVVDLSTLREASPFRKVAMAAGTSSSEAAAKSLPMGLALLSATYREPGQKSEQDCPGLGLSIQQRVKLEPARILEIVEGELAVNPACACEVVKAALTAAGADAEMTAQVVEAAATVTPESLRLISQCAIAAVPDSLAAVQAVLARLDPGSGESGYSSKSSKSAKSAKSGKEIIPPPPPRVIGDPLDRPRYFIPPPPFNPPPVTDVDCRFR